MKKLLLVSTLVLALTSTVYSQAPVMGTTANFALFSTNGAVSSTGLSHVTGHVGTNNGSSTNFGNVDGVMHDADGTTAIAAADLTIMYDQLDAAIPNFAHAPLLGNGETLMPGTHAIGQSASLNNILTLNGLGNANSVFIFQIEGAFSSAANAQVVLTNGALACNVFWKVEGLVDLAANTVIKGTIVANNAAIILNTGTYLEGRALTTTGAVTVHGVTAVKPIGCGSPVLTGPPAPPLGTAACYTIFSGNGEVTDDGASFVTGDIGTNVGLTTGYVEANVTGTIHSDPDTSTAQCALDVANIYTYLNTLPIDIELLYPAAMGGDLVLTPHTYLLNAATAINGSLIFNAQNNPDAVFVLNIYGALSTGTFAGIQLINGAQAKNVFIKVDGAISLNSHANFKGTIIGNGGAVILNNGVTLEGRVLSTGGGITTFDINAVMTPGCGLMATTDNIAAADQVQFYPNPFAETLNISTTGAGIDSDLRIFNTVGALVFQTTLTNNTTNLRMALPSGMYFYKVTSTNGNVQSGKLVSK